MYYSPLEIDASRPSIGVDIGGSYVKAGLVVGRRVVRSSSMATFAERGPEDTLARVAKLVCELCPDLSSVDAVGVGMPGLIKDAVLIGSFNMPGWKQVPVAQWLSDLLGKPVTLQMDIEAIASGELLAGGHEPRKSMFVFTLGTGVGAAAILERKVHAGAGGFMLMNTGNGLDDAGSFELLEHLIAAPAILRNAREEMALAPSSILHRLSGSDGLTIEVLCEAAWRGDKTALKIWRRAGAYLGWAAVNVAHLFLLDRVIVGGGVSNAGELLLEPASEFFARFVSPAIAETCDITVSSLGNDAGIIGAAMTAAHSLNNMPVQGEAL